MDRYRCIIDMLQIPPALHHLEGRERDEPYIQGSSSIWSHDQVSCLLLNRDSFHRISFDPRWTKTSLT